VLPAQSKHVFATPIRQTTLELNANNTQRFTAVKQ